MALFQCNDLSYLPHSPIHTLMAEAAMQGANCTVSSVSCSRTLWHAAQLSTGEPGFEPATFLSLDDPLSYNRSSNRLKGITSLSGRPTCFHPTIFQLSYYPNMSSFIVHIQLTSHTEERSDQGVYSCTVLLSLQLAAECCMFMLMLPPDTSSRCVYLACWLGSYACRHPRTLLSYDQTQ